MQIKPDELGIARDRQTREPHIDSCAHSGAVFFPHSCVEELVDARSVHCVNYAKSDRIPWTM